MFISIVIWICRPQRYRPDWHAEAIAEREQVATEPGEWTAPGDAGFVADAAVDRESVGAGEARANLLAMAKTGMGFISKRWTPRGLLMCLEMNRNLKPGFTVKDGLACAAEMFFSQAVARNSFRACAAVLSPCRMRRRYVVAASTLIA